MPLSLHSLTILLQVFDMPASLRFYRDLLGFSIVETSSPDPDFFWAMLKQDHLTLMLNTAYEPHERPNQPDPIRNAAHTDTSLFFNCASPQRIYDLLLHHNWPVDPPVTTHYGMTQVYTRDPDGYQLCFQALVSEISSTPTTNTKY